MRAYMHMADPRPTLQEEEKQNKHPVAVEARRFVTTGWRIHNEATYRGINWILNSTIGVAFSFWGARTAAGQKYFTQPMTHAFRTVFSLFTKEEKHLAAAATWGSRLIGIMIGGFTIIPLMMVMENKHNKKKIVRWLDQKIYGKDVVENDPRFEESYRRIDDESQKHFWSGVGARFIALAPIFVLIYSKTNELADKHVYQRIGSGSKWVASKLGIQPAKMMSAASMKECQTDWDFIHQTIGFDISTTFAYSFMHEVAYKTLAAFFTNKKKEKIASQHVHEQMQASGEVIPESEEALQAPSESWQARADKSDKKTPEKAQNFVQSATNSRANGLQAASI